MENIWEPKSTDEFRFLKDALRPHAAKFVKVYRPIRHNIYGHRLMADEQAGVKLFPQTNREELGQTLDFLHDLVEALTQLYERGTKPELGRDVTEENESFRVEARQVMRRLAEHVS